MKGRLSVCSCYSLRRLVGSRRSYCLRFGNRWLSNWYGWGWGKPRLATYSHYRVLLHKVTSTPECNLFIHKSRHKLPQWGCAYVMLTCFVKLWKQATSETICNPLWDMANFGVIFRKWRQFLQCVYIQSFRVTKNHSHKKAIMGAVVTETKW